MQHLTEAEKREAEEEIQRQKELEEAVEQAQKNPTVVRIRLSDQKHN